MGRRRGAASRADSAPVNPGKTKAEMSYLRSVYHQNRSVGAHGEDCVCVGRAGPGGEQDFTRPLTRR